MLSFNKTIRKIHLWSGITCGLIASFSGLTGSLYVWQPEITAALNPELLKVENIEDIEDAAILKSVASLIETHKDNINQQPPGKSTKHKPETYKNISTQACLFGRQASEHYKSHLVSKIFLPYREQQTISIQFKNGKTNYYHPLTNEFLGEKSASISFFENLLNLHRTLGVPKIGKYIIGTSAVIFFLFILTSGVYIWWKVYAKNLREGFKIKWKSKKRKFNFDLHKTFGIYFFIPLLIIAFTGAYFTYNTYYKSALKIFDGDPKTSLNHQQKQVVKDSSIFNELLSNTNESYALRAIYFPQDKTAPYRFRYIEDRYIKAGLRKTKEVEISAKGEITTLSDFRFDSNSNRIAAQFYPIHIGEIAGVYGRILVFISGLVPLVLFITGFRMYRLKKSKTKKRLKKKRD
ncbi:PepSY-associated TM helix domain-containing protein [Galbibacter sp. EGI 63066]|uniref:PepSY-associated TM helix domain-containing protein n=1 Tax=Galbibacter sp. EGI 63066 TaxID=2993559 RepID=UPI002248A89A|nr:PepSY-associated TM helix domain-containing protein [Galbibacter sp. EGI 63066]MCX2679122.1 PepSY-associated TM helix domain-containing protein [Galbibacter sp. EGI 63066]